MSGFSVDKFVPAVVALVRESPTMDVLLLAARALASILELFPTLATPRAVSEGVVPALCAKLLEIEYMDVAELALQILERIVCKSESLGTVAVAEYRRALLQEHGVVALLQYVDFFPIAIQRTAARIVSALCTNVATALVPELRDGFALVTNLLASFDAEILESACDAMRKLVESKAFSESPALASLVASDLVCDAMLKLLRDYSATDSATTASPHLAPTGYTSILKFFANVLSSAALSGSSSSAALVARLRFYDLPPIVTALLTRDAAVSDHQLLRDTLKLVIVLLPIADELKTMAIIPEPMVAFAHASVASIVRVYDATARSELRYECLGVLYRTCSLIYAQADAATFSAREHAELTHLAAFLARVLRPNATAASSSSTDQPSARRSSPVAREQDVLPVHLALQIIHASLVHAASARIAVIELFERHGVATAIRFYAAPPPVADTDAAVDTVDATTSPPPDTYEVVALSKALVTEYFGATSAPTSRVVQLQAHVDDLLRVLSDNVSVSDTREQALADVLTALQSVIRHGADAVTAHEMACSGLVRALTTVLSVSDGKRAFTRVFLAPDSAMDGAMDAVAALVQCLQDAIAAEKDAFSVAYDASLPLESSTGSSVSSDLVQLTQHVKVRVLIDDSDLDIFDNAQADDAATSSTRASSWFAKHALPLRRSGSSGSSSGNVSSRHDPSQLYKRNRTGVHDTVVLVEPLARVETMEEFILDKLFGSTRSVSALDELIGRRATSDDDHDGHEDADDDAAHAATDADEREPKQIQALYCGVALPADMSILEAIVKYGAATRDDSSDASAPRTLELRRIWSSAPHEVTFRILASPSRTQSLASVAAVENNVDMTDVVVENNCDSPATLVYQWWDNVWDLLALLKLVRALVLACPDAQRTHAVVFTNAFLSLQVNRVLQQPVRVVTNALPRWCFRLVQDVAFVLDYDTRLDFAYAISCGSARAIQYLCRSVWKRAVVEEPLTTPVSTLSTRSTTTSSSSNSSRRRTRDGGDANSTRARTTALVNISRMVKLPRLKVRVARSRLLQSAMKLLAIYGGKKAVIEIEFLGEVGTGLGPTTEFFTLICQEIQAKHLRLWRDDDVVQTPELSTTTDDADVTTDGGDEDTIRREDAPAALPIRGYHRVAVYHCAQCLHVRVPHCAVHKQLLTHEATVSSPPDAAASDTDNTLAPVSTVSIPQCADCRDTQDWHSAAATCDCSSSARDSETSSSSASPASSLKWWILSDEEVAYLAKVFPRKAPSVKHPVLQCAHCDTVNFPGTDAGIVTLDGDRMVSRSGRRMFERDYRAVTKHVSPLCEGTPLTTVASVLTRETVEQLVALVAQSPEVLETEVESLHYVSETAQWTDGGPAVLAPFGLFPKAFVPVASTDAVESSQSRTLQPPDAVAWFTFLGQFVAQAVLDERLLNLPLSRPLLRALRGEALVGDTVDLATSLAYIGEFDPALGASLRYLYDLARAPERVDDAAATVDAMCLTFTLVGDSAIELCRHGATTNVTLSNLLEYVQLTAVMLLDTALAPLVAAFERGFAQICGSQPHERGFLRVFDVPELERMLSDANGAATTMWDRDGHELRDHTVCDHGYTPESRAIRDLIAILCDLPIDDQRLFVRFVTGANRLPVGGLAKLEPKLTVVRKFSELAAESSSSSRDSSTAFAAADAVLPSASTCTNYLKLPEYSTRDVMKQRLLYCIREGQGSFHLS